MRRHAKASVVALILLAGLVLGVTLASATAPVVTIENASAVKYTSAKVIGSVDPQGQSTSYRFQYATQADFSDAITGVEEVTETSETVEKELTGLQPATTYHLRLVAENADGPSEAIAASTFTTEAVTKPTPTLEAPSAITANSAHFSGLVNPNAPEAAPVSDPAVEAAFSSTWSFECIAPGPSCAGPSGTVAADNVDNPVPPNPAEGDVTGLEPNTEYHLTLRATNAGGEASAEEVFSTEAIGPVITPRVASNLNTDGATLRAAINPSNAATTYHFEWGPDSSYGHVLPAGPEAEVSPTGNNAIVVTQTIFGGLAPDTTYHFRVVATNSVETVEGPDQTFTTSPPAGSSQLPDDRAYELVSPPDKNGSDVLLDSARTRAAVSGNALQFTSLGNFADSIGSAISTEYIAERTAAGWKTHGITPQQEPGSGSLLIAGPGDPAYESEFAPDLSRGVVRATAFPAGDANVAAVQNLFVRDDLLTPGAGSYQLVTPSATKIPPQPFPTRVGYRPEFAAASADFSHVLFEATLNLIPEATGNGIKLYEWDNGTLRLPGVLPTSEGGGLAPLALAGNGSMSGLTGGYAPDSISDDGSRVFFTVTSDPNIGEGRLYMRENHSTTIRIDASEKSIPDTSSPAKFWAATPDGSRIFFTTAEQLTEEDLNGSADLYRYDVVPDSDGNHLTRVSGDQTGAGPGGEVRGVMGVSDDGDRAYFVSRGRLVNSVPALPPGTPIVYAWHAGDLRYAGVLDPNLNDDYENFGTNGYVFTPKTARVTPDGKHLLFTTYQREGLNGHDHGSCDNNLASCREVYVYSAEANGGAGKLVCVSCDPAGAPGSSDADVRVHRSQGGASTANHLNRPISNDGRYVFFHTGQALVAEDHNSSYDVYRYDTVNDDVRLISSGAIGAGNSYFLDASASGEDVFFATRQQLVGWDTDANVDVYDARVGGGFPEPSPASLPCANDICRQAPSPAPSATTPASAAASGSGNAKARHRHKKAKHKKHHQGTSRKHAKHDRRGQK